jgi:hypothetical protein
MKLAATHTDGRKLYAPEWDSDGEIVASTRPVAAVSIDRDGVTFPAGSTWIRNSEGWTWAKGYQDAVPDRAARPTASESTDRLVNIKTATKNITRHRCECEVWREGVLRSAP